MTHRAVFFDAGETLVYAHPSFPELFTQVMRLEGFELDPATVRGRLYAVADEFNERARERGVIWSVSPEEAKRFWGDIYRTFLGELGLPFSDALAQRLYDAFTDLSNYRLFPDVLPTLERLHAQGLALGVVSNFEEWLERLLERLGVARYCDVRVISGVEGLEKPDPRIFQLALERAGVEPQDAVYVGDNPILDIEPASRVGMLPVLIDRRGRHPQHAGIRITTLDDLPVAVGLAA